MLTRDPHKRGVVGHPAWLSRLVRPEGTDSEHSTKAIASKCVPELGLINHHPLYTMVDDASGLAV